MRALRRRGERRASACRVVIGNSITGLHGADDNTVVDELEGDNARRLGERPIGGIGVAGVIVPIEDDVAGNVVEELRRAGRDRILGLRDCRQRLVLDLDCFRGIARSGQGLGHDQRNRLTDMAHLAEREHRPRRVVPRLAIAADERRGAGNITETVRPNVISRGHQPDSSHAPRCGAVDALDARVRHRRAQHEGMRHARQGDVVRVAALSGEKTQIFMPPHGLTDPEFHAVFLSLPVCLWYRRHGCGALPPGTTSLEGTREGNRVS